MMCITFEKQPRQVGEATYSQSARISSSFLYPNNWRLALAKLKPHDGGLYDEDGSHLIIIFQVLISAS